MKHAWARGLEGKTHGNRTARNHGNPAGEGMSQTFRKAQERNDRPRMKKIQATEKNVRKGDDEELGKEGAAEPAGKTCTKSLYTLLT